MSDFKTKMHQIRFLLGFRPRPYWGSLQRYPSPVPGLRSPTSKGKRRGKGKGGERKQPPVMQIPVLAPGCDAHWLENASSRYHPIPMFSSFTFSFAITAIKFVKVSM